MTLKHLQLFAILLASVSTTLSIFPFEFEESYSQASLVSHRNADGELYLGESAAGHLEFVGIQMKKEYRFGLMSSLLVMKSDGDSSEWRQVSGISNSKRFHAKREQPR